MNRNYAFANQGLTPMQVHYYGTFMSYSTTDGDFLCRLFAIKPYTKSEVIREQVDTKQVVVNRYDAEDQPKHMNAAGIKGKRFNTTSRPVVINEPVYTAKRVDATPPFTKYGKPIMVGDSVTFKATVGTLVELTDTYFAIDSEAGRFYFPWTDTNVVDKVTRSK